MARKADKSEVFRRAWRIYGTRKNSALGRMTFGQALRKAWADEKRDARFETEDQHAAKKARAAEYQAAIRRVNERMREDDPVRDRYITEYYATARRGAYVGD